LGIGVIYPVPREQGLAFETRTREEGMPDFRVRDISGREIAGQPVAAEHYVITYIDPVRDNREALGLDIASEARRRAAADASRDSGQPQITDRITLVQDEAKRAGFLLLLPIYQTDAATATSEERRANLMAWIYAPFVAEQFFHGIFAGRRADIGVQVYWGDTAGDPNLVFSSGGSNSPERITRMVLGGQTFSMAWHRGAQFKPTNPSAAVWAGTSMATISLLVAGLVMSLHQLGQRAREIAARRTAELAASSERLSLLNAQLEEKNAEFRNFAHTASHDLREPLRSIQAFSELLLDDHGKALPADGQGLLRRIGTSVIRMSALIENLLAYAEVESRNARMQAVDLDELVNGVEHDLEPRMAMANVAARVEKPQPLPTVNGDPTLLRQLFQNLIVNALKFHRAGIPPVITIEAQRFSSPNGEPWAIIAVADNGIGFDPVHADRIFRPFDRLHRQDEFEGSGLGLAICRRVVERHGGKIHATGAPDAGARFTFTLPLIADRAHSEHADLLAPGFEASSRA
jgi:signal transduction histidine kinase